MLPERCIPADVIIIAIATLCELFYHIYMRINLFSGPGADFEEKNPSLNIFLDRTGLEYQEAGRYEDHSQAIWMDGQIREFMDEHIQDYLTFLTTDIDGILSAVEKTLNRKKIND